MIDGRPSNLDFGELTLLNDDYLTDRDHRDRPLHNRNFEKSCEKKFKINSGMMSLTNSSVECNCELKYSNQLTVDINHNKIIVRRPPNLAKKNRRNMRSDKSSTCQVSSRASLVAKRDMLSNEELTWNCPHI